MAMGAGGGFERDDFYAPMAEINTTPLVDVMLVLLVIFLVTAPMLTQAIKMELPSDAAAEIRDEKPITISVDAAGQYFWESEAVSADSLQQRLQAAASGNVKQPIYLRADSKGAYGPVSHALALAQRAGLTNVGLITEPK